jgi:hypothetical protein
MMMIIIMVVIIIKGPCNTNTVCVCNVKTRVLPTIIGETGTISVASVKVIINGSDRKAVTLYCLGT